MESFCDDDCTNTHERCTGQLHGYQVIMHKDLSAITPVAVGNVLVHHSLQPAAALKLLLHYDHAIWSVVTPLI